MLPVFGLIWTGIPYQLAFPPPIPGKFLIDEFRSVQIRMRLKHNIYLCSVSPQHYAAPRKNNSRLGGTTAGEVTSPPDGEIYLQQTNRLVAVSVLECQLKNGHGN